MKSIIKLAVFLLLIGGQQAKCQSIILDNSTIFTILYTTDDGKPLNFLGKGGVIANERNEDGGFRLELALEEPILEMGLFSNSRNLKSITIPDGITAIGNNTFHGSSVKTVHLPASIYSIGASAFEKCDELYSLLLPVKLKSIGDDAFNMCTALETICLPESVAEIGAGIFMDCKSLSKVVLSSALTDIPMEAFSGCLALKSIVLPGNLMSISSSAFENCGIEKLRIPRKMVSISRNAFKPAAGSGRLIQLNVPEHMSMSDFASFYGMETIPEGTVTIRSTEERSAGEKPKMSEEYGWIVGTWGAVVDKKTITVLFNGNGESGDIIMMVEGVMRYGKYIVDNGMIKYHIKSEGDDEVIEIRPGHKLLAGNGKYYTKKI